MTTETSQNTWSHSFWEFFTPIDTCLMGWFCPCILFGKTQARLEDPTLKDYSPINDNTKKRDDLRKKYGITETRLEETLNMQPGDIQKKHKVEGSLVEDCLGAFFCRCCGLVQEEKEVILRQSQVTTGYQKTQGMEYA
ncbi:hypothetical protein EYZ11_007829 [Aspergillus tanneri]|uniref:DUF614 domain protein n=1 Tax=Aspergillus tanneri TaxID=1220188 RepID=A0A4S3JC78_9EURO|nr:hypothetical protein EYZ11_007829 [Aspergillus tanneri]